MYSRLPSWVLGFHGCNKDTYDNVFLNEQHLLPSTNTYDWLGHGIYFWENNYDRALEWAESHFQDNAAVIGAILDLGNCLNLSDSQFYSLLESAYIALKTRLTTQGMPMPKNRGKKGPDTLLRDLDCSVIEQLHEDVRDYAGYSFDSVRGLFIEGDPVYPGSGLNNKTHIQLCIVNSNCIKGYFKPLSSVIDFNIL